MTTPYVPWPMVAAVWNSVTSRQPVRRGGRVRAAGSGTEPGAGAAVSDAGAPDEAGESVDECAESNCGAIPPVEAADACCPWDSIGTGGGMMVSARALCSSNVASVRAREGEVWPPAGATAGFICARSQYCSPGLQPNVPTCIGSTTSIRQGTDACRLLKCSTADKTTQVRTPSSEMDRRPYSGSAHWIFVCTPANTAQSRSHKWAAHQTRLFLLIAQQRGGLKLEPKTALASIKRYGWKR